MRQQRRLQRAIAAGLLASTSACYTARPLTTAVPPPATRVLASLTDSGTVVMGGAIGGGATGVEGIVTSADGSAWDLQLLRVTHRDGQSVQWNREVVRFPRSVLTGATEKRIDAKRSAIGAALLAVAVVAASHLFSAGGGDTDTDNQPTPEAGRVPVARFPLHLPGH